MSAQDAFREMEANGLQKEGEPTAAAAPEKKQQEKEEREGKGEGEEKVLPKLSAAEFRVYNRMAEHMDLFVRSPIYSRPRASKQTHPCATATCRLNLPS